jgi:tetratricopeptide (TPR) repeat protein
MEEKEFLEAAVRERLLTAAQVEECRRTQDEVARTGIRVTAWEVCGRKGWLTAEQVARLRGTKDYSKAVAFGAYTILSKIGEGGNGTVYLARKQGESRHVALKVLPQRLSANAEKAARFEREARVSIELSHPNLVKGYEFGRLHDRLYYAMEYVKGRVVADLVRERGPMSEKAAIQIAVQVARALAEIGRRGLCHRDVKPENIIIGEDGVARLMDLGLIKPVASDLVQLTQDGVAVGTLHYMSPEQVQGREVDIRSDIYSLGATLYFMLTGVKPFKGTVPVEIFQAQLAHDLEPARSLRPDLSEGVAILLETMMARDPADRPQDPNEVLADLAEALEGRAPARAPARPGLKEWLRHPRNRLIAAAAGAGLAALLVTFAALQLFGSGPPPPRTPPRPRPPEPIADEDPKAAEAEAEIRRSIREARFSQAAALLEKQGDGAAALREELRFAVEDQWLQTRLRVDRAIAERNNRAARAALLEFERAAGDIAAFPSKIAEERARIDRAEREHSMRVEALESFRVLEDSIRDYEAQGRHETALAFLEGARPSALQNPHLIQLLDERIELLRRRIAGKAAPPVAQRKPEEPPPPDSEIPPPPPAPPEPSSTAKAEADALWEKARSQFDRRDLNGAIRTLGELIKAEPEAARGYGLRARCFVERGNPVNAREDAAEAIRRDPNHGGAHLALGLLNVREGRRAEAIHDLTRAIAGDPASHEAYQARAEAFAAEGQWKLALRDLEEAERTDPAAGSRRIEVARRRVDWTEKTGELEEAARACEEWIRIAPGQTAPLLRRADLHMRLEWFDEARADYEAALKIEPRNSEAQKGKAAALKAAKAAVKPAPRPSDLRTEIRKSLEAHFNAARIQVQMTPDGRAMVNLTYDFFKPKQIEDFATQGVAPGSGFVEMDGTPDTPAALVFKGLLFGDFFARAELQFHADSDDKKIFGIRTASRPDVSGAGDGIGVSVGRPSRTPMPGGPMPSPRMIVWSTYLYRYGDSPGYPSTQIPTPIQMPFRTPQTLSLREPDPSGRGCSPTRCVRKPTCPATRGAFSGSRRSTKSGSAGSRSRARSRRIGSRTC